MLTVISIFVVYITLINSVILLAFFFKKRFNEKIGESSLEKASVIIAFRNEKENLPELIHSLKSQSLSPDNFEVIFVDDYSTDGSFEYLKSLIDEQTNFKVIKNKYEQGKKFALKTGIDEARFDILIFTDADCIPDSNWLKSIVKAFDKETDIVYGYSPFLYEKNFMNKICQYENLFTSVLMTAFHNVEFPYMSFGRNFAYRKSLFLQLGGYKQIEHSLSGDDDLFFQLAIKNGARAKLIDDKDSIVYSKCKKTLRQFIRQKSRHISASKFYSIELKSVLGLIYSANILLSLFIFPAFLFRDLFLITFIILNWFIKSIEIFILTKKLHVNFPLIKIPLVDPLYFLSLIIIGIRSRFKIVRWK